MSVLARAAAGGRLRARLEALLWSPWAWAIAVALALGVRALAVNPMQLVTSLGDTDDATRLVQVRELIATGAWFDTTLSRLGGETPLVSHWSRLLDLPMALAMLLAGALLGPATGELVVRFVWPLALLAVLLRLAMREAELRAGTAAAAIVAALVFTGIIATAQFGVGRIDHHNAMILTAVAGLLALSRAFEAPAAGLAAGALLGLSLAVGYEALAVVLPAVAVAALAATVETRWLDGARRAALAMAGVLAAAFLATIAPARWLVVECDALALNMLALAAAGAVGLALVARVRERAVGVRLAVLFIAGAAGLAAYLALEPACIAGPFGKVDAAVKPIWLDGVKEGFSIVRIASGSLAQAAIYVALPIIGLVAQVHAWWRARTADAAFLAFVMATALALALWQLKFFPYATWIATVVLAVAIARLPARPPLSLLSVRLLAVLVASQAAHAALLTPVAAFLASRGQVDSGPGTITGAPACQSAVEIARLGALPPGLFVGPIDFGPYIVALTHHQALSAPYHRIDKAILAADQALWAPPAVAERLLRRQGASYVVDCLAGDPEAGSSATGDSATGDGAAPPALARELRAGRTPLWLQRVELPGAAPELAVWRLRPAP